MKKLDFSRYAVSAMILVVLESCGGNSLSPYRFPSAAQNFVRPNWKTPRHSAQYRVIFLGALGGNASQANGINDRGWITGYATLKGNRVTHAVLWASGRKKDLGTLGGPNSAVYWPVTANNGEISGLSEIKQTDPFGENFCHFNTPHICVGFLWSKNVMTQLPTLGGNNAEATGVNGRGEVVGAAENSVQDQSCAAPQVLDYYAVVWERNKKTRTLPPISGDAVSQAAAINRDGWAVGASGPCGPPFNNLYGTAHAVLWKGGSPVNLGTLGAGTGNAGLAINDRGEIVGIAGLPSSSGNFHAVLWKGTKIKDLGTLQGDVLSAAQGINNKGQIVGQSCDASGNCRAFLWQNGSMIDLNQLVPHTRYALTYGGYINDKGRIVGAAYDPKGGASPAFLAVPTDQP